MKNFTLTTLMVFYIPLTAMGASPHRLNGLFKYKAIEVTQVRDVEVVHASNKIRYQELLRKKYQCFSKGAFYQCQKHLGIVPAPDSLSQSIREEWQNNSYEFVASNSSPEVTNESERLTEWDLNDVVKFNQEKISTYHYYLLDQKVHKAVMKFSADHWINIISTEGFSIPLRRTIQTTKWKSRVFELSVIFKQI